MEWRSFESIQIDRNKVQICTNWQKGTRTKKHENLRDFENFKEIYLSNFPSMVILWPHDSWPGTLDHLAISLMNNRYKKIGKISENLLLIFGLAYLPLAGHCVRWINWNWRNQNWNVQLSGAYLGPICTYSWFSRKMIDTPDTCT